MEEVFNAVKTVFTHRIRLSPFDVEKRINIVTDGANSSGVGFVLFQNADDLKQGENVSIVKANSSGLRDCQKQYYAMDTEVLALKFACDASFYYLYGAPLIHVYTDCISLEGIFHKPLGDIKNRRIRDMVEKLMGFTFEFHYVPAEKNEIADCFSRLTQEI